MFIKILKFIWILFIKILKIVLLLPFAAFMFSKTMDHERFEKDIDDLIK